MSDTEMIASKGVREGMTVKKRKAWRQQQIEGERHVIRLYLNQTINTV